MNKICQKLGRNKSLNTARERERWEKQKQMHQTNPSTIKEKSKTHKWMVIVGLWSPILYYCHFIFYYIFFFFSLLFYSLYLNKEMPWRNYQPQETKNGNSRIKKIKYYFVDVKTFITRTDHLKRRYYWIEKEKNAFAKTNK